MLKREALVTDVVFSLPFSSLPLKVSPSPTGPSHPVLLSSLQAVR